jgi:hypothetical protein
MGLNVELDPRPPLKPLLLPYPDRTLRAYTPRSDAPAYPTPATPLRARVAFAAAHVVRDPLGPDSGPDAIDWSATLAFRSHLWRYGLGVAEAMDTAQRGMGLDYPSARVLIAEACRRAQAEGGRIACGAGTDQLPLDRAPSLEAIADAYEEQCAFIEAAGGEVVLMASRALARVARTPQDYARVLEQVLKSRRRPVILHWLGPMFDPQLAGYWGSHDLDVASEGVAELLADHADTIAGIKLSLLDADREIALRRRLPAGIRMFTGDDFNYPDLIQGDEHGHSDALLGVFDPLAPLASCALQALDAGDVERYRTLFAPSLPLARTLFEAPTFHYKTGVVFLAYLNGFQNHFQMLDAREGARTIVHLAQLYRLADGARVLLEPQLARERMQLLLRLAGVA